MVDHDEPRPQKPMGRLDQLAQRAKFKTHRHFPKGVTIGDIADGFAQLSQVAKRAGLPTDANKFGADAVRYGSANANPKKR
jgi:hypothetical protein